MVPTTPIWWPRRCNVQPSPRASTHVLRARSASDVSVYSRACLSLERKLLGAAAALVISCQVPDARAEEMTFEFRGSSNDAIRASQTQLVEVYAYVNFYYVDATFHGVDWQAAFQDALQRSYKAASDAEVRRSTRELLAKLGDPYTRILPASSAARKFQAETSGKVVAYGIAAEFDSAEGRCLVSFVAPGSSAAAVGVAVGDAIEAWDGRAMDATVYQQLKEALQSRETETLSLTLSRRASATDGAVIIPVELTLTDVDVNPSQYSVLTGPGGEKLGYVRIVVFADTVPAQVAGALQDLTERGVSGLILDLRDNPGGLVSSGLNVGRQLLKDRDVFVVVEGRDSYREVVTVQESVMKPSVAALPLVVLVNHGTASTSEMLSGALRVDRGAVLIGETTLGKGRSQRIVPLSDGSLLLLSSVTYRSADEQVVDKRGLAPDVACVPEVVEDSYYEGGELAGSALDDDPCVKISVDTITQRLMLQTQ